MGFLTPTYFWGFGSSAGICLVIQIATGIFLAMHYTPHVDLAFLSVEHIMRDVSGGWLLRYMHANGASMLDGELESYGIFAPIYLGQTPRTLERLEAVLILPRIRLSTPWKNSCCSRKRLHEKSVHSLVVPTVKSTNLILNCCMIHFTWHLVSYSHITLKLGAKASLEIANHVRNNFSGASSTRQNHYPNPQSAFKVLGEMRTLVALHPERFRCRVGIGTTLGKGVSIGTMMRTNPLSDPRHYISSIGPSCCDEYFGDHINELVKQIKSGTWPKGESATMLEKALCKLQEDICQLSSTNHKKEALALIDKYTFNVAVRFIAIRKIRSQSGSVAGTDRITLKSDSDCLEMLRQSRWSNQGNWPQSEVKRVEIPKPNGKVRALGIGTTLDRVLQKAFHLLIDPYYEALYPADMYGFRKGRGSLQAVGALKRITEQARSISLGILSLDIIQCFDSIEHDVILHTLAYPDRFKFLIQRWLKPWIRSDEGQIVSRQTCGVAQGSIIGPLICNVTLMNLLHGTGRTDKLSNDKPEIFSRLKQSRYVIIDGVRAQRHIRRHLIYYADDIIITTTHPDELDLLFNTVGNMIARAGLKLSREKTNRIDLRESEYKKLAFDYMGFKFVFVPSSKIRIGGILTRKDDITLRKKSSAPGTFLVYTSDKRFNEIKEKCFKAIKKLTRLDLISVISEVNSILRGHTYYFGWSNSYLRLFTLEGLVFRAFKKSLIKKFRDRGKNRPRWVAGNFLVCSSDTGVRSPHNRTWHVHVRLPNSASNRLKSHLFLILPTKLVKLVPINYAAFNRVLRSVPYYSHVHLYEQHNLNILKIRRNDASYRDELLLKQKGRCSLCDLPLLAESDEFKDSNPGISHLPSSNLEIHHKIPLAGKPLKTRRNLDRIDNLELVHKHCHRALASG
eukprot:evm.model.scf_8.2 EVM.evm.TU.scf_8.2   scf_8:27198-29912(-)